MPPGKSNQSAERPQANFVTEYNESLPPPVNTEEAFNNNYEENLSNLAKKVHPNDPEAQEAFKATLVTSIESVLNDRYKIEDLWKNLDAGGCKITKIIAGILRFYKIEKDKDGNDKEKEMDIGKYLKMEFPVGATSIDQARESGRSEIMSNSIAQLGDLLRQIKSANPNIPNLNA